MNLDFSHNMKDWQIKILELTEDEPLADIFNPTNNDSKQYI